MKNLLFILAISFAVFSCSPNEQITPQKKTIVTNPVTLNVKGTHLIGTYLLVKLSDPKRVEPDSIVISYSENDFKLLYRTKTYTVIYDKVHKMIELKGGDQACGDDKIRQIRFFEDQPKLTEFAINVDHDGPDCSSTAGGYKGGATYKRK